MKNYYLLILYFISINVFAYSIMWYDKMQAIKNRNRISENSLFAIAFIGGAIGIYLGIQAPIKHKSAKPKFKIGIPLMIAVNIVVGYYIYKSLQ